MKILSSRSLALAAASAYAAVSALLGTVLVITQQVPDEPAPEPPYRVPDITAAARPTTDRSTTSTTTTPSRASRYCEASGANGLVTVLPCGWRSTPGQVSTVQVATNPADPTQEVRYGGAPPEGPGATVLERITHAHESRTGKNAYQSSGPRSMKINGHDGARWVYSSNAGGSARSYAGHYWETRGVEYVILVSSTAGDAAEMDDLLDEMTKNARP